MPDPTLAAGEGEFAFIARHLRPLAAGYPGALDLADDAALLEPTAGMQLVLTKDALVESVHFLPHDTAEHVAQKALRVNLSDMAAMGATPRGYLLALMRPRRLPPEWLGRFSHGLGQDQAAFGVTLLGGRVIELDFVAENGREREEPVTRRQRVSEERLARIVAALEEASLRDVLVDPDLPVEPDADRDLFFERVRLGLTDEPDTRATAQSTYTFQGTRERPGREAGVGRGDRTVGTPKRTPVRDLHDT